MNIPQLRFKGFEEEWQEINLDEILEFKNGLNYLKSDNGVTVFTVGVKNFNQKRLHSTDELEKVALNSLPNIDYQVEKGDLLFVRSNGNKELVGRMMISELDIENIYFSGFVIRGRVKDENKIIPLFMFYLEGKVKVALKNLTGGTNISNLSQSILNSINVRVPEVAEQEKITSFLLRLDKKIEKQKEKIENLEQFKKGMMQKIFSRELRFKDDDGGEFPEWEEKKLGQVLKIKHGRDQKKIELPDGKFPILATGGIIGRTDTFIYDQESVLIGRKGTIDRPVFMHTPFWTVDTLFYSEIKGKNYPKFVFYVFQSINWKLYNEASGVPSLSAKTIEAIKIMAPNYKEQKLIADYLSIIDKKIEKEKEKSLVLEQQKKGFMQKIFI